LSDIKVLHERILLKKNTLFKDKLKINLYWKKKLERRRKKGRRIYQHGIKEKKIY